MSGRSTSRRGTEGGRRHYPRSARVNEVLRHVLAEELERLSERDERLSLLTITAVETDPDLRHATVFFSSLDEAEREALGVARVRLQAAVSRQVRIKWTPLLSFEADPAVAGGQRVEEILRAIHAEDEARRPAGGEPGRQ